jgi:hypothetical protein
VEEGARTNDKKLTSLVIEVRRAMMITREIMAG